MYDYYPAVLWTLAAMVWMVGGLIAAKTQRRRKQVDRSGGYDSDRLYAQMQGRRKV